MTCKGSDQTERMRRLICGFAGRTYDIAGNLMSGLKCGCAQRVKSDQSMYQFSLITTNLRSSAVDMEKAWVISYTLRAQ